MYIPKIFPKYFIIYVFFVVCNFILTILIWFKWRYFFYFACPTLHSGLFSCINYWWIGCCLGVRLGVGTDVEFSSGSTLFLKSLRTFSITSNNINTFSKTEIFSIEFFRDFHLCIYYFVLWIDCFVHYQHFLFIFYLFCICLIKL